MTLRWLRALLAGWLLAGAGLLVAHAHGGTRAAGLAADLRAGRPLVVVVIDHRDRRLLASEAYADWQAYHQRFVASGHGRLPVYTLAPQRARALLPGLASPPAATLFVDTKGRGLLHPGLVLEPEVYRIGRHFAETGETLGAAADHGLREIAAPAARPRRQ